MSARPPAARVASARAGAAPRATSRPAGRGGAAPRGGAGPRSGSTASGASSGAARARNLRAGGGRAGGGRGGSGGRGRGGGEPGEPRQITLRTAGFALVLLVAFIVLAPTLRAYVTQQEQLREVNAALAETSARAEALREELARWSDPDFVKSQAADRFGLIAPGERAYRVVDPETVTGEDPMGDLRSREQASSPYASTAALPWYATVWSSVEVAGSAQQAAEADEADPTDEPAPDAPASDAPATDQVPDAPAGTPVTDGATD